MADCLGSQLLEGLGTVISGITVAAGYSQTIATVEYDFGTIDRASTDYAVAIVSMSELNIEALDNENQEVSAKIMIEGTILQDTDGDVSLAGRKEILEFAADFRYAINTLYTKQQAGTFAMKEFEIIGPIRQSFDVDESPPNRAFVLTELDLKFKTARTDR